MTRAQGWWTIALLAFLCVHLFAADVVGLYLYSQIKSDTSTTQTTDNQTPKCDPEGDVCP
jgi:hypothetical protein